MHFKIYFLYITMINTYEVIKNNKVVFSGSEESCNSYIISNNESNVKVIPSLLTITNAKFDSSFSNDRSELYIDNVEFVKIGKNKWEKHLSSNSALGGIYSNEEIYNLLKKSNEIEYDTLLVESKNRTKVNIFLGRFQPFTKGHLKVLELGKQENNLPTVILMIQNTKMDEKHPFSDDLIKKEMEIIKSEYKDIIKDILYVKSADILAFGELLHDNNYEPVLWLTGTDRLIPYTKMAEKYKEQAGFISDFKTFEIKRGDEDISATKVRNAIKNNDINEYKNLMPKNTDKLFNELKTALENIPQQEPKQKRLRKTKESLLISLSDFIKESLLN